MAGDVSQCKLDQFFGHLKNVIVIADDIVIVGKKPSHSKHDQALTTLCRFIILLYNNSYNFGFFSFTEHYSCYRQAFMLS